MDLKKILHSHSEWLTGREGERASLSGTDLIGTDLSGTNLSGADLIGTDLSGTDLIGANLSGTDLSGANLSGTNLSGANLSDANLSGANLSGANLNGANLSGANLRGCTGNGLQVFTLHTSKYPITYTHDRIQIGCKNHSHDEWLHFSDGVIRKMDFDALTWWKAHKDWLFQSISLNSAQ